MGCRGFQGCRGLSRGALMARPDNLGQPDNPQARHRSGAVTVRTPASLVWRTRCPPKTSACSGVKACTIRSPPASPPELCRRMPAGGVCSASLLRASPLLEPRALGRFSGSAPGEGRSSPMRCMGRPHSAFGQVVSSGSWRCSTRSKCSGSAWRRGRRSGAGHVARVRTRCASPDAMSTPALSAISSG